LERFLHMPGAPLAGRSVEFQVAVSGLGMILYEKPADLDNAVVVTSDTEVHGIRTSFRWQMGTVAGVSHVAATAQLLIRGIDCGAWRGASACKAISER
jgi:hypothetical protein